MVRPTTTTTSNLIALLTLTLTLLLPLTSAQAPSQSKIAACQASITIPSYQDYYYYDVNDTSPFSVTYQYDGTQCTGVPVAGISFTDYTTGSTSSCTSAPFSSAGTYTSTCQRTKGSMAATALAAGPDGSDFSTTLKFGVKPTLYVREDIFSIIGSDSRTTMVSSTSTSSSSTSTTVAPTTTSLTTTTTTTSTTAASSTITSPPSTVSEAKRRRRRALTADQIEDLGALVCEPGYTSCPSKTKTGWLTQCVDTTNDLYACGGCPGIAGTQDCSELPGIADVSCVQSMCQIDRCDRDHKLSPDGASCMLKNVHRKRFIF